MEEVNNVTVVNEVDNVLKIFRNDYNKQVVLFGPPGTSKTHSALIIAAKLLSEDESKIIDIDDAKEELKLHEDRYKLVQFHPSYNYEDFVRGISVDIKNLSKDGEIVNSIPEYKVVNKVFGKIAAKAQEEIEINNSKEKTKDCSENKEKGAKKYVLVIDEINRASIAAVLGELIYGLEYRGEAISTPYCLSNGCKDHESENCQPEELVIPENLYIIATMNTADRSIGSIDYAVRRRFAFVAMHTNRRIVEDSWSEFAKSSSSEDDVKEAVLNVYDEVQNIFVKNNLADPSIHIEDIKIGHTYFLYNSEKCDKDTNKAKNKAKEYMKYRIEYQIVPLIEEYIKDGLLNDFSLDLDKKKKDWLEKFS